MIKKSLAGLLAVVLISSVSVASAQAATATNTPGGICAKSGAMTLINGKTYTCIKALNGKLVWAASATPPTISGTKPQISGGTGGAGGEGGTGNTGDDQGFGNNSRQNSLTKYNACLVAHGGIAIARPTRVRGVRPTTGAPVISPAPKLSAAQSKAITVCTSLALKIRPQGDD